MQLQVLNKDRGIYAIFQGYGENAYIIYSTFYDVVAIGDAQGSEDYSKVNINFKICRWAGYWSLRDIINRGVKKLERQFKKDKEVIINYEVVNNDMEAIADLKINVCLREGVKKWKN